jgi:hypothetical protein
MNLYEVKFVNIKNGVTIWQKTEAHDHDEALRLIVQKHNDFLGVDYDPELDPDTLVIVTRVSVEPEVVNFKVYEVTFSYTMEVVADDEDDAESIAWELFCEEGEASHFYCEAKLKEKK